jgi:hypothetical protein
VDGFFALWQFRFILAPIAMEILEEIVMESGRNLAKKQGAVLQKNKKTNFLLKFWLTKTTI